MDLRQALEAKKGNETFFDLQVAEVDPADAERLTLLRSKVRLAMLRGEPDRAAQDELDGLEAGVRERCFYRIRFRNLAPHDFEALVSAHPARKDVDEAWNADTLPPVLLAACAVDSDLTAEEWAVELKQDRWSVADRLEVYRAALDANIRQRSETLPKG